VVTHLVAREFRLRYRQAVLGWIWAIAQPLARFAVLAFLFTQVVRLDIAHYPAFLFSGLLSWSWFSSGLSSATASAVDRRDLLFRPGVPRVTVPVISVLADGLDLVAALPVLGLFLLAGPGLHLAILALPGVMAVQALLTLGLGLMLCSLHVYLRDTKLLVDTALVLGFYLTPVFYTAQSVPARYRPLIDLNPMTHIVQAYRQVLVNGHLPTEPSFQLTALASMAVFVIGLAVYHRLSPAFVDEL
jgi:lipopolysaccharide transport system permease protein